jgi:hypothetical protein
MKRMISVLIGSLLGVSAAWAQDESPYMRVVTPEQNIMRLDLAVRTLVPEDPSRPIVHLVGAVHIGDASFYRELQAYLDIHDVILYEGVGGAREPIPERGDEALVRTTERRLRFLKVVADDAVRNGQAVPTTPDALVATQTGATRVLVEGALEDAWGNEIEVARSVEGLEAVSLGSDGEPGGEGAAADIALSDLLSSPGERLRNPGAAGLQRDMADALGLEFQLDGIDYGNPHWRNSDLSVEQIQAALAGKPLPPDRPAGPRRLTPPDGERTKVSKDGTEAEKAADALFGALSGDSFMAKTMGFLMKMVGSSKQGRAMVKIMLADTLTNADELLSSQEGALGDLMKVLTVDRNKAVVEDLEAIVNDEPGVRSVAIFYGAGHFTDLEEQLAEKLGYHWESTMWLPAMTIDLDEAGLSSRQVEGFRKLMKNAIRKQLEKGS